MKAVFLSFLLLVGMVRGETVWSAPPRKNLSLWLEVQRPWKWGMNWLIEQQNDSGGWGEGNQEFRQTAQALFLCFTEEAKGLPTKRRPEVSDGLERLLVLSKREGWSREDRAVAIRAFYFVRSEAEVAEAIEGGLQVLIEGARESFAEEEVLRYAEKFGWGEEVGGLWERPLWDSQYENLSSSAMRGDQAGIEKWMDEVSQRWRADLESQDPVLLAKLLQSLLLSGTGVFLDEEGNEQDVKAKVALVLMDLQEGDGSWATLERTLAALEGLSYLSLSLK
ncbi:MAG: hypothetical protein AAGJ31_02110 [Verrucomicrobiota bacterium]